MLKKLRFYLSPYFPIRYYLRRDVKYFAKKYGFSGKILDIGCGQKPYAHFFGNSQYFGIDFDTYSPNKDEAGSQPDAFFDDKYSKDFLLPFKDESFDGCVSFQVLEHHTNPEILISEMARITKQGGFLLVTCPFIYAMHDEPNDYQRITEYKLTKLFETNNCERVEVIRQGSLFSSIAMLISEQMNFFAARNRLNLALFVIILPFFLCAQYGCILLDYLVKPRKVFINYASIFKKK